MAAGDAGDRSDDVVFRGFEPADVDGALTAVRASEVADRHPLATSREELAEAFDDPDLDPAHDAWVVERAGEIVGFGRIQHAPSGERLERAHIEAWIDPAHRGVGVGRELLARQIDRATRLLQAIDNDLPKYVRASAFTWCEGATSLYARAGMTAVRWFEDLGRPLDDVPSVRVAPEVRIVPYERSDEVRLVINEAFADHWGSTPRSPESWKQRIESTGVRLDLSFVALAGDGAGEVIGALISSYYEADEAVTGLRSGWIDTIGVLREWRGRGVASSLIVTALHAYRAAGFDHAMLGVDADNPTGAARLYKALGFETLHTGVTYELAV